MGTGLFWGIILIIIGLSIIFKLFFDISIMRIVIAVAFILIGVRLLIGKPFMREKYMDENNVIFGERTLTGLPENGKEYNTIFGKTVYDLRNVDPLKEPYTKITINTIFGSTDVLLSDSIPVIIKADAVFSEARMPNNNTVAFGSSHYRSPNTTDSSAVLEIDGHVVFGSLVFRNRDTF